MSVPHDDTLDEDGSLAGAVAGDDELARPVDVPPDDVLDADEGESDTGPAPRP